MNDEGDIAKWFDGKILPTIARGEKEHVYNYRNFFTLGASLASRELSELAGHWVKTTRTLDLTSAGSKRRPCDDKARSKQLVDTYTAKIPLLEYVSQPHIPEWLDGQDAWDLECDECMSEHEP